MSSYLTTATAASTYYLQTNPSGFQTAGDVTTALSPYLLSATAASTYAVIAAGQPTAGTTGQVLTKNSGTNYDSSWTTIIPGDRYLTSSTTSNSLSNTTKTFTIGTGLSYTPTQSITIAYDASNHMHGEVLTYNSGTGVLTVDINHHTGSGTYASWVVNVGGVTPATSVAWGAITGTISAQSDLQGQLDLKLAATTAAATYLPLSGGNMPAGSAIVVLDGGIYVYESVLQNSGLLIRDSASTPLARFQADEVLIPSVGITFSDLTVQTSAGISAATAASTYQTIAGMSSYATTASLASYAPLASPALTGNVTITSNSASPALVIVQDGAGDIVQFQDVTSDTTYSFIDASGKVNTIASTTANAGFNIAHGAAPTSPANGDIWTTTSGLFARINAGTQQFAALSTNNTFSNASSTYGNSTAAGTINIGTGATISGATKAINIGTNGASSSTTNITLGSATSGATNAIQVNGPMTVGNNFTATGLNINIGTLTATANYNFGTGALVSGATRAIGIGTNALAGSTNNITIGSAAGASTTTLQGTTNGITEAVDTNNTQLATTAFVVGQASSTTPLADGTAAVGTSLRYARADHVHPSSVGGGGTDYQAYTTPGTYTWTKPANAKWVEIVMFGGGGGGGSGARNATTVARGSGGGGGGGAYLMASIHASALASTESVIVGAGGTGGPSVTTDTTSGSSGQTGESSVFSILNAGGGTGGGGGSTAGGASGTGKLGWLQGASAQTSGTGGAGQVVQGSAGTAVTTITSFVATGGGGGGGSAANNTTARNGGNGGIKTAIAAGASGTTAIAGGSGGTQSPVYANPTAGLNSSGAFGGGTGGGGGGYANNSTGQTGGAGGFGGGGGGGGSASDNGFASGAGGAGGSGAIYIITYC
jgi:hypothetical protein